MFKRNSRSDSARATDENNALDLFPLEREDARRGTGSTGDPVDVSYRDSVPFDEGLLYEASGEGMRRLAFLEWRRRVLKICFTALALAGVFVAFVVMQRSPFSLWFSQDEPPSLVSEADTATPVPSPPVDLEPPVSDVVADAVPPAPPAIDQPPAQPTIDQSVNSSTRVENPPRAESNKRSGNDQRTAGNPQIQTNPATQGGARGQNVSRVPHQPPLAAWKVGVPATSPSTPVAQTPASPPPVAQTQDKPDTNRALVPPDSNKARVSPDVNRVRISPDVNKVVLPSQAGAPATPAATSTPEKTASSASAAPPTSAPPPAPASPPPPRPAATPPAATSAPPATAAPANTTPPPSVTTSPPATTTASSPGAVRPPAEAG